MAKAYFGLLRKVFFGEKNSIFSILVVTMAISFNSCTSLGYVDGIAKAPPVEERCLLELAPNLSQTYDLYEIGGFWEKLSQKHAVIISAGYHELSFKYERRTATGSRSDYDSHIYSDGSSVVFENITTTYDVAIADGVPLSYTFEAGHHYYVTGIEEDGGVYIEIGDLGTNTGLFHNGVYTGGAIQMDMHLGSGGLSYVNGGVGFGYTGVFDFGTPVMFGLQSAIDFGVGEGDITFGAFGGLFGNFFIPGTIFNIGAGYGYRTETGLFVGSNAFYSPFVRGELGIGILGLYFEYYTDPRDLFDTSRQNDMDLIREWSLGLFFRA